jgi:trehalose/maltose transport system permease protein
MGQPAATTRAARGGKRSAVSALTRARTRLVWIFLAPTLAVVIFVAVYPLLQTLYLSLTDARLGSVREVSFVGLDNYTYLFTADPFFFSTVRITVFFALITVFVEFLLGLIVALVINSNFKGRGLMRAAMLIPWAIITVVSAQMWKWMYNDVYGVVTDLLGRRLGLIDANAALPAGDTTTSLIAVAAVDIWKTTPFVALLLLAGLQVISHDLYEAAGVDSANRLQKFTSITLPLLRPAILVALIFRTLDALRVFDVFYMMFGARPDMQTMAVYAQQNLVAFSDLGLGSAICVTIFLVIAIFVAIYVTVFRVEEA